MVQIEVEDNVKFTSLVENDIPLRDWKLLYEDEHRNQRLYCLERAEINAFNFVMVSFSTSDGNIEDCWTSESLYVDVIFKAWVDYSGLHHLHLNQYICYPETGALIECLNIVHKHSEEILCQTES
ncbi:hypothetical protein [Vibrio sp. 1180_3]|uniref:hypothetical protein n=1 Tax=Vibrio sp. 1180_3 TaxID=2528832 RepID=UPI00240725B8|nr:hypothetical protein [Vibrio sp. 1180_3]MDF9399219.1 hypothetical protein [Vibrio sp. 1180_3]